MTLPIFFTDNAYKDAQQSVVSSNIQISAPYKTSFIACGVDATVDIESGYELSVDNGCCLIIINN
jgi:hypothetical protein